MEIIEKLRLLIGEAPPGLEWLEYLFALIIVIIGLVILTWLFKMLFSTFNL